MRENQREPLGVLHSVFGHAAFRPGQAEIVEAITARRDVLAVLSTGSGKSVCFQVPALLASGPTLVVSPLVALMHEQVAGLGARGVPAVALTAAGGDQAWRRAARAVSPGRPALIYAAPERLADPRLRRLIAESRLSAIVVDEAHCISDWGHDFRPLYRQIGSFATALGRPPVAAFTATATPATRSDIERQLALRNPARFIHSVDRPNLAWSVASVCRRGEALRLLAEAISSRGAGAAIVYVPTRALAVAVAAAVRRLGHQAAAYHAGLSDTRRAEVQGEFLDSKRRVIAATCAFGMGIDHPGVRLVAHLGAPGALEAYVQEAGRAGRDGRPARCLLLSRPQDHALHRERLREMTRPGRTKARRRLAAMRHYIRTRGCRRRAIARWFGESPPACRHCDNCETD